jgi:hypothetical protein
MSVFTLSYKRPDGTYVAQINGLPYHVTQDDPLYAQAQERDDGTIPAEPSPDEPPFDPLAYAIAKRLEKEVSGITVSGVPIATDDRSKIMIIGARVAASADPDWSTPWAATDGNSYPVDSPTMFAIADAVQAHVNTCFKTYASVVAAIGTGSITTKEQIDAAFA